MREHGSVSLEPMQLAGILLEKMAAQLNEKEAERLVWPMRASR
jgi:hypothetical protein